MKYTISAAVLSAFLAFSVAIPVASAQSFGYGGGGGGGGGGGTGVSCNLVVSPAVISLGSSATLSWSGSLVSTVDINGVETSAGVPGSTTVTPTSVGNTSYIGVFHGSGGTITCSTTLHVAASQSNVGNAPGLNNGNNGHVGQVLGAQALNLTSNLHLRSRGADVTALQQFLIDAGYSIPGGASGYFGGQTLAAVIAYQKAEGISPAAGYVGLLTRGHLNKGTNPTTVETTGSSHSSLTAEQSTAILGLLQSFNADASVIAKVKASLGL